MVNLRTEYLIDPLALDELLPRLSWSIEDERPRARQTACQIRAASSLELLRSGEANLWDSGRLASHRHTNLVWAGTPLGARTRAYWDVTVWSSARPAPARSVAATFEIGLTDRKDWAASWIGAPVSGKAANDGLAPLVHRRFRVERPIQQARLYVTALGLYDAHINGVRVGDDWFRPGWTDYRARVQVQTYDVTKLLHEGDNGIGFLIGDGWYAGRIAHFARGVAYDAASPALLAQLEVIYDDGTATLVATDATWRYTEGPIRRNDLLDGEEYDARREVPGWSEARCDDSNFQGVEMRSWPAARLVGSRSEAVQVVAELTPVSDPIRVDSSSGRRTVLFDLGQNIAGVARLRVCGPSGATIRLRHAEMLEPDGQLYTENLREARAVDSYTLSGDPGGEIWAPRFTCHGFRYVELSHDAQWDGEFKPFTKETVTGLALGSAMRQTGDFSCSDELLNRLQSNIVWSQRSNFLEVPTDCPQRDERLGWTGDAQIFAATACFNMDAAAFLTKWMYDLDDAQRIDGQVPKVAPNVLDDYDGGPGWSDARVLCAWELYLAYGDTRVLERHYDRMVEWLEWQAATSCDGIRSLDGCGYWQGFGDWLSLEQPPTPLELIGTAHFARSSGVMVAIADLLGRCDDAERFKAFGDQAVTGFTREFLTDEGRLAVGNQTAHLLALAWDLLPADRRTTIFGHLVELLEESGRHLQTGFLGTPLLCPVLTRFGRVDLAYDVLMQREYPGWLYPVTLGATTLWERWDGWTPDAGFADARMNSFNHYAYGAVGRWIYDTIGGLAIDPSRPGYEHVLVAPRPGGGLTSGSASIASMRGLIESRWEIRQGRFALSLRLPPGVTATVTLPEGSTHEVEPGTHFFKSGALGRKAGGLQSVGQS